MKTLILSSLLFLWCSSVKSQESQNTILSNFESGNYIIYKVNDKKKFELVKKKWPVEITKQGDKVSQVLVKRAGILDELFKVDVPGYPAYFAFQTFRLSFIKNYAVYYEWNGKQQATTKYILVKEGGSFSEKLDAVNKNIAVYATATFKNQTGARANVKETKEKEAEIQRKINSIEGKGVSKIEIKLLSTPSKVAHFSEAIPYGVIATLKDGSQLKTPNLGGEIPWEDFKLNHKGCSNTIDEIRVDEDAKFLTEDRVFLSVESNYNSSLKTSKFINTTNDVNIQVNQNGFWGWERSKYMTVFQGQDGQHAARGDNLTIKVKTVVHKQTGTPINKIEIYNNSKNKLIAQYKLTPSTELIINTKGGQGDKGRKSREGDSVGGKGGNGGDGGLVTVIKDPSVTHFNLTINNGGGQGGQGGAPHYSSGSQGNNGSNGSNGNTVTQTQSITLNF
jgi:hypothetical protein